MISNLKTFCFKRLDKSGHIFANDKNPCELISNGNRLLFKIEINEAFLNFWIALDTVLNESDDKKAESNRLKNRIAALTFQKAGLTLGKQYFKLKELNDLRSALVHQGTHVNREDALDIEGLTADVLDILLVMLKRP